MNVLKVRGIKKHLPLQHNVRKLKNISYNEHKQETSNDTVLFKAVYLQFNLCILLKVQLRKV